MVWYALPDRPTRHYADDGETTALCGVDMTDAIVLHIPTFNLCKVCNRAVDSSGREVAE